MSREILFKAKRKDWCELPKEEWWIEGGALTTDKGDCYVATSCLVGKENEPLIVAAYKVDPETLCQYTEKEDKNENKIFDGAIIKNEKDEIGIVQWFEEHAAFMIWYVNENIIYYLGDNNCSKVEIIGNIFDNPELLK